MDVDEFITEAMREEADIDPDYVREIVRSAPTLADAREKLRENVSTQAVADRIIQEIVLEDDSVSRETFAKQMPLIEPRNEKDGFPNEFFVGDLSVVGERRYILRESDDIDGLQIVRKDRTFLGVADNGDVGTQWEQTDTLRLPEDDADVLGRLLKDWQTELLSAE